MDAQRFTVVDRRPLTKLDELLQRETRIDRILNIFPSRARAALGHVPSESAAATCCRDLATFPEYSAEVSPPFL